MLCQLALMKIIWKRLLFSLFPRPCSLILTMLLLCLLGYSIQHNVLVYFINQVINNTSLFNMFICINVLEY